MLRSSISTLVVLTNLLFRFSPSSSAANDDLRLSLHAKKLISEFNLFPDTGINIVRDANSSIQPSKIVEKRLIFPNVLGSDSGVSADDLGHYAGYYPIQHSHAARMFYFFFESRNSQEDPVVIWLTGGPGCSSELALFYENGPFKIADNLTLVWNEYGWDKVSNLLYVDQPTGTGFSYSTDLRDIRHDEKGVSNDLYDFLQAFFAEHPQLAKNDFFITGESYAGHYIPAFASRIRQGNLANEGIHINLKGLAIGNGLTNPAIQYKAYPDYALDMGIITKGTHGRLNKVLVPACELSIKLCGTDGKAACLAANIVCNVIFSDIMLHAGDINDLAMGKTIGIAKEQDELYCLLHKYYDIRKKCEGSLCYDFSNMEKLLNQKSVRDSLGVGKIRFVSCSTEVYAAMLVDWMRNLEVGIPVLLEDGINLLVYAGEFDLICNWLGNSRWVHAMEWSGQKEFVASPDIPFVVDGSEAGSLKNYGPLSFLKVHDAGHMVPMDQPKAALEMLKKWTRGILAESRAEDESLVAEM
ncbi:serine carboxypeptidase-like isoform X1 [Lotus japonicus]|uniref:serine carboxypeptidase-like isoform X1 n=1 Tax=Lotus japonicus TaxID=34305 RepID=UPI0025858028|nr:serine carboxypeptidase-like isoform X1 [Lotus japonicus]